MTTRKNKGDEKEDYIRMNEDDAPPISEDLRKKTETGNPQDAWKAAHGMASESGHDHEHEHGPVHSDQTGRKATEDWKKNKSSDENVKREESLEEK